MENVETKTNMQSKKINLVRKNEEEFSIGYKGNLFYGKIQNDKVFIQTRTKDLLGYYELFNKVDSCNKIYNDAGNHVASYCSKGICSSEFKPDSCNPNTKIDSLIDILLQYQGK
jgi:hypothetical protein